MKSEIYLLDTKIHEIIKKLRKNPKNPGTLTTLRKLREIISIVSDYCLRLVFQVSKVGVLQF